MLDDDDEMDFPPELFEDWVQPLLAMDDAEDGIAGDWGDSIPPPPPTSKGRAIFNFSIAFISLLLVTSNGSDLILLLTINLCISTATSGPEELLDVVVAMPDPFTVLRVKFYRVSKCPLSIIDHN